MGKRAKKKRVRKIVKMGKTGSGKHESEAEREVSVKVRQSENLEEMEKKVEMEKYRGDTEKN